MKKDYLVSKDIGWKRKEKELAMNGFPLNTLMLYLKYSSLLSN